MLKTPKQSLIAKERVSEKKTTIVNYSKDVKKFKLLLLLTTILIVLILSYNVLSEYFIPEIKGYLERRFYYERVISKKGLSLHKGMYWKEKEE